MKLLICGIGGQGAIFLTSILAEYYNPKNKVQYYKIYDEGQKNGSVSCHLKINEEDSPLIDLKSADILASLDSEETKRNIKYLKDKNKIIEGKNNMELLAKLINFLRIPMDDIKIILSTKPKFKENMEKLKWLGGN